MIEIIIAILIGSILLSLSFSYLDGLLQQTDALAIEKQLISAIQFARHESMNNKMNIGLCTTQDFIKCNNWDHGNLIIFLDQYRNGIIEKPFIKSINMISTRGRLFWRGYPFYRNYPVFSSNWINQDNGKFWFCVNNKKMPSWIITLNKAGKIKEENVAEFIKNGQRKSFCEE